MNKEKIYKFSADIKVTEVESIFIAPEDEVEKLKDKQLPLGEVADNVDMKITCDELRVICDDPEKVKVVKSVLGENIAGPNPIDLFYEFNHLECDENCSEDCDGEN